MEVEVNAAWVNVYDLMQIEHLEKEQDNPMLQQFVGYVRHWQKAPATASVPAAPESGAATPALRHPSPTAARCSGIRPGERAEPPCPGGGGTCRAGRGPIAAQSRIRPSETTPALLGRASVVLTHFSSLACNPEQEGPGGCKEPPGWQSWPLMPSGPHHRLLRNERYDTQRHLYPRGPLAKSPASCRHLLRRIPGKEATRERSCHDPNLKGEAAAPASSASRPAGGSGKSGDAPEPRPPTV